MPPPVDTDTRLRFLAAYRRGEGTVSDLSRLFGFSEATGKRLLRKWRERGDVSPLPPSGGHERQLIGARLAAFIAIADANLEATHVELAALWYLATGASISRTTVRRALADAEAIKQASSSKRRAARVPAPAHPPP